MLCLEAFAGEKLISERSVMERYHPENLKELKDSTGKNTAGGQAAESGGTSQLEVHDKKRRKLSFFGSRLANGVLRRSRGGIKKNLFSSGRLSSSRFQFQSEPANVYEVGPCGSTIPTTRLDMFFKYIHR